MVALLQAGPLAWLQHAKREPSDPFDLLGDVLDGQFRVESFEGEGELSVVYKGHHIGVDAPVAIKCLNLPETLHPALARPLVQGFKEASRIHYRLARGNLHIAQAVASGSTLAPRTGQMVPYLVREWFDGESLASELGRRRKESRTGRSLDETLDLLKTAFDGVAYAHAHGEVHLALNPTNLFLARSATVASAVALKVLDFGMAGTMSALGSAGSPSSGHPSTGLRLMLPAYAAPEQLERAVGRLGPWTDVYALAVIMLEVLSDRMVLDTSETGAVVERVLDEHRRPTPQSHGVKLPPHVDRALARAVARAPEARQGSAEELWRELSRSTSVFALPWAAAAQPPRPSLPKPPLRAVAETSAPIVAEVADPVPAEPETVSVIDVPEEKEEKTEVFRVAARAIPEAASAAIAERPRVDPLLTIRAWVNASRPLASRFLARCRTFTSAVLAGLKPFVSKVHAVLVEKWPACLAMCRRLLSTRSRKAIFVGAAVAFLILIVFAWRPWSSRQPSTAASTAKAHADPPPPAPLPAPMPAQEATEPAAQVSPSNPFDRDLALRALDRKWRDVAKCRHGKEWGKVWTTVAFAEDGTVSDVVVGPPFVGTPTGQCIVDTLARVRVRRFDDGPASIDYRVYVAPR